MMIVQAVKTATTLLLILTSAGRGSAFHLSIRSSIKSPHFSDSSGLFDNNLGPGFEKKTFKFHRNTNQRRDHRTELCAIPAASVGVSAIAGAVAGGVAAGGLHAIAGPDHLAALLPRCCGQRWFKAGRVGAVWGMGHGISATLLGVLAFALKSTIAKSSHAKWLLSGASSFMEIAVGVSLVFIGLLGMKEAKEWEADIKVEPKSLSAAANDLGVKEMRNRSVLFNGVLHGFSWDGAPSLAPAVAVATWRGNISFLLSYAFGTMATMAVATTLIGEGTRKAGEVLNRPDIPQKLSYISSYIAILIGAVWCGLAFA